MSETHISGLLLLTHGILLRVFQHFAHTSPINCCSYFIAQRTSWKFYTCSVEYLFLQGGSEK